MEFELETKSLTKHFGKQKAVDQVSIHVPKGSVYGLVGRNGAGKTTIMKMVTNLMSKDGGHIYIGKKEDKPGKHKAVGTLIEAPGLIPSLSARNNLLAKAKLMKVPEPVKHVDELLGALKLDKVGKKAVKNFSLGMRQRVGIAMAFVGWPNLVLLDEPINALDPQGIIDVRHFLDMVKTEKNITVLISSHLLDELAKVADYFGVIDHGRLIREFSMEQLRQYSQTNLRVRVNDVTAAKKVLSDVEVTEDGTWLVLSKDAVIASQMNEKLMKAGIKVYEFYVDHIGAEEFFLKIMGGENYA